ncbi:MAG: alginate export family protein [Candidatus Omnitrophota bacterium]
MKRIFIAICALGLVAALISPALAEVQNIKVGGSIDIRGFSRKNYTTANAGGSRAFTAALFSEQDGRDWYNMITKVGIEADLTDNVIASMILCNEQDINTGASNNNVQIYESALTLKELLYSPLTVKVGKMPMQVADGLVIGNGVLTNTNGVIAGDYQADNSFFTVHGILDYDPLTLLFGTAKLMDQTQAANDDIDVYLIDAIYKMEDRNAVLDTYLTSAHYSTPGGTSTGTGPSNASTAALDVYVLAATLNFEPLEKLAAKVGVGYQFGDYQKQIAAGGVNRDLKATAFDLALNYAFEKEYSPKVGLKYVYRSGEDTVGTTTGDYKGWLGLYESQKNGLIYDPNTNTNSFALSGSLMPLDRLSVALDIWFYQLAKKQTAVAGSTSDKRDAGNEIDLILKYAYTEDVTMGFSIGWFSPGDFYVGGMDKAASQVMAEVGVKF